MKRRLPMRAGQSGVALVALLALIILAASYAFYRSAELGDSRQEQRDSALRRLAQAKEALITYAVIDATRPGRLPCPDLVGNGVSPLLARDDCDAYGGWLPWKTLDLPDGSDSQGSTLYYHLSPLFGGDRSTPVLNSETATSLRLNQPAGAASNDIVALVIAPRGPLDAGNADGDDYFYSGRGDTADDNDQIIAITRQELMAAVEQRIANELRTCLEQHATSPANPEQTYPWPAPLANAAYRGAASSLFGMFPDTQPGNPEVALKETIVKLNNSQNSLISASTAATQRTAVSELQQAAGHALAFFDRSYLAAADLAAKAELAGNSFAALDATLVTITQNKTTYQNQSATLPAAIANALPSLAALRDALANNGFDIFLGELQPQNAVLKARIDETTASPTTANFNRLITPVNLFKNSLLDNSQTPNASIDAAIGSAWNTAVSAAAAVNLARKNASPALAQSALAEAGNLYAANQLIATTIEANRVNVNAEEVAYRAGRLAALQAPGGDATAMATLLQTLNATRLLIAGLTTGSTTIGPLRTASLNAIDSALAAAGSASQASQLSSNVANAAGQLNALAAALASNADNVALETLKAAETTLTGSSQSAPANVTAGRALRTPVGTVVYWADLAAAQAADIARLARKGVTAQSDSDASAYSAARQLLDSIDGSTGTLARLDHYIATPDAQSQQAAQTAIANTLVRLATLLAAAANLDNILHTSQALAGVPTAWQGDACAILNPSAGWWTAHNWKSLFFYQISDRIRPAVGQLTVNGGGTHRAVVVAAGSPLPGLQNRALRQVASYLEKGNADVSRNGDALTPVPNFQVEAVSPVFNDRLAY